jgi:hypothetical protein
MKWDIKLKDKELRFLQHKKPRFKTLENSYLLSRVQAQKYILYY